ncbi:hypothetical protein ACH5RR_018202 [Cinchona calisaya]|uniref:Pentatricopeptide repeat-containing protein n=1 Tax=Cinchona calisaya TaxID=153742 RepID=A0ABD2ZQV0_9GENT
MLPLVALKNALEALIMMRFVPGKSTIYDYNSMIYCYLKFENVLFDELVEVYNGMKRFGPCPNALTYNNLLNGMVLSGSRFDERVGHDVEIELCSYGTSLNMLILRRSKAGMAGEAYLVFSVLLDKGLVQSKADKALSLLDKWKGQDIMAGQGPTYRDDEQCNCPIKLNGYGTRSLVELNEALVFEVKELRELNTEWRLVTNKWEENYHETMRKVRKQENDVANFKVKHAKMRQKFSTNY